MSHATLQSKNAPRLTARPAEGVPVLPVEKETGSRPTVTLEQNQPSALAAGSSLPQTVGDCELLEEIGRGAMGVVYKARQSSLDRLVAVKMILHDAFITPEAMVRFEREARAAAALDHPNIVPVYEFGQWQGRPYFVMPLIEGDNLATVVAKHGPRPPGDAVALLLPLTKAVQSAHKAGIIHRDLKPSNIMIDSQGRPRITDFGVAKQVGKEGEVTAAGQILGTPAYMAPEQARGDSRCVGPAADVYALGGILFFLLTGQAPFVGRSLTELLLMVDRDPVRSPRSFNPEISPDLEKVVLTCLEKDPARRYGTAADLHDALVLATHRTAEDLEEELRRAFEQRSASGLTPSPPRVSPTLPFGRYVLIGLAAVLVLVGGILWQQTFRHRGSGLPPPSPPPGEVVKVTPSVPAPEPPVVLPEASLHDFKLEAELIGVSPRPDGLLQSRLGDKVGLRIQVDRDAYVGVWNIDPRGNITQLFPNAAEPDHQFRANVSRTIPGNPRYDIEATELSTGIEQLRIVASTVKWDPFKGSTDGLFTVFRTVTERKQFQSQLSEVRGLGVKYRAPDVGVSEANLKYEVVPARVP